MNMKSDHYHPAVHWLALLTAAATFPLIFMGGLVTSHQAGMSVPDWPNSYGYNMFLFPPSKWVGGILYEHTHRLMGAVVGFLAILLTAVACGPGRNRKGRRWIVGLVIGFSVLNFLGTAAMIAKPAWFHLPPSAQSPGKIIPQGVVGQIGILLCGVIAFFSRRPDPRPWVRKLTIICLAAVCLQGLLGGLRVDLVNLPLAIVHGCFAQAFFCFTSLIVVVTSKFWINAPPVILSTQSRRLVWSAIIAVLVIYLQLIVGAVMRHEKAGLAVIDFPLIYGKLLPPTSTKALAKINVTREIASAWETGDGYSVEAGSWVTLWQIWIHSLHRYGAVCVSIAVLVLVGKSIMRPPLRWLALTLIVLLATQMTLGALVVILRKPADLTSAHVAVGALTLMTAFVLTVRSWRLYMPRRESQHLSAFDVVPMGARMAID
jgi:cytochrome c oxidase assembly protein subunit 15